MHRNTVKDQPDVNRIKHKQQSANSAVKSKLKRMREKN
ncbi:hypothetical protein HBNCFIEN_01541 [Legionella sp. PC997]|nr:hypothetical protein HBNCFIEN_01541 [Legionella sp. PC997]